jgi:hypothetical protein
MLFGLIYLKGWGVPGDLRRRYDQWRRARLRRKFEVYYNDRHRQDEDKGGRWKN